MHQIAATTLLLLELLFLPLPCGKQLHQGGVSVLRIHQRGDDDSFAALDLEIPQEPEFEMGGGGKAIFLLGL